MFLVLFSGTNHMRPPPPNHAKLVHVYMTYMYVLLVPFALTRTPIVIASQVFPFQNFLGSSVSLFGSIVSFVWLELVLDRPVDAAIAFTAPSFKSTAVTFSVATYIIIQYYEFLLYLYNTCIAISTLSLSYIESHLSHFAKVLSWNALLKESMMTFPNQFATLLDCYVSIRRIQQLLTCQAGFALLHMKTYMHT